MTKNNNPIYQWNLEKILNNQTIEELINTYLSKQQEFLSLYEKDPFQSIKAIKEFHNKELELDEIGNKVSNYLSNKQNSDLANTSWFLISQQLQSKSIDFCQKFSNYEDVVLKNKEKIINYLNDSEFSTFKKYYQDIFDGEPHKLTPEINKFCATYSQLDSSYYSLFTLIFDKELTIKPATDSKNKIYIINNYSDYLRLQKHDDRELRKSAYINWTTAINDLRESFARLMFYNFLELNVDAKNHNFPKGYFEASMFSDNLPLDFVPFLYDKVSSWKKHISKYRIMKNKIIASDHSLDKVKAWDSYLEIKTPTNTYSINIAKEMVCKALSVFGPEYQKKLENAFNNGSIDWFPRKNKISGAYCIGQTYGLENKYVLLNYKKKLDDVLTLAHELGHAIHAEYFCESQTHYAETTIFVAEIPSILNELLLNYFLLNEYKRKKNLKKQLEIYDHLISSFIATTSSQLVFSEWEYDISNKVLSGEAISADIAEQLYLTKKQKYFGLKKKKTTALDIKSLTKILTVPHFYAGNFYVYKYAIGNVVSLLLAPKILDRFTNKKTVNNFYDFLRSGNSKDNLETIKLLGIDLTNTRTWNEAEKIFKSWISEYKKLFKQLYKD